MNTPLDDWRQTIREAPELQGGPGLWLAVILTAIETINDARTRPEESNAARKFFTDKKSSFNLAAAVLGYDPDALRKRIHSAIFGN